MIWHSIEPRTKIYVNGYGFLSFMKSNNLCEMFQINFFMDQL